MNKSSRHWIRQRILRYDTKSTYDKEKIDVLDLIKLQNFGALENTI